jgi:hypothetical protein
MYAPPCVRLVHLLVTRIKYMIWKRVCSFNSKSSKGIQLGTTDLIRLYTPRAMLPTYYNPLCFMSLCTGDGGGSWDFDDCYAERRLY